MPKKKESSQFRVSQSKVKTWRRCHYAYHLRYVEELRKIKKSRPLQFGTMVHRMLEVEAEGDDPMEALNEYAEENSKMFKAEREEYGEIVDDVRQIMTEYFSYYPPKNLKFERRNGKSGEHEFEIEILPDVIWNGKIDATGKTPNKLKWIVERKTFSRKPDEFTRWSSIQSATYLQAVDMMGWGSYDGMCWDYIRSKPPARPGLLKDGKISFKNIDTLPITVRETAKELGLKPKDYKPLLIKAEERLPDWFERVHTPVDRGVVNGLFDDFVFSIKEMVAGHGKVKDKNIERHCMWCDYNSICSAELQSLDVDYVRQKEFENADKQKEREERREKHRAKNKAKIS